MVRGNTYVAVFIGLSILESFGLREVSGVTAFVGIDKWLGSRAEQTTANAVENPFELPNLTSDLDTASSPLNGSQGEVVGSTGRIGSLLLRSGLGLLAASPRGLCPGSLSPPGTPIFVAVPAQAVLEVILSTPLERRGDLVLIVNGLPSRLLGGLDAEDLGITVSVPHFGVLQVGGDAVTSPRSPPTLVYGRHSAKLRMLLEERWSIRVVEAESFAEVEACAVRKLLWTSLFWLLCHEDGYPINVSTVHEEKSEKLRDLVAELLPAARTLSTVDVGSVEAVMEYLESYSMSMPEAIPNKQLAIEELSGRNGVLLQIEGMDQPLHRRLIAKVAGEKCIDDFIHAPSVALQGETALQSIPHVAIPNILFASQPSVSPLLSQPPVETAVVIGAGIIGSSVALGLARRGINVTVIDQRNIEEGDPGATTSASWAWINANNKNPRDYFYLNHIGMSVWRNDPALKDLPVWCGSLVRERDHKTEMEGAGKGGAYCCMGPLDPGAIAALEPNARFCNQETDATNESFVPEGSVAFFPDEGYVDPIRAVQVLRNEAKRLGATFLGRAKVASIALGQESNDSVVHLEDGSTIRTHVVIASAGVASSSAMFGGVPMLRQPGVIAFANRQACRNQEEEETTSASLHRILVDTVNESHVLERQQGQLVIGGGYLQVGGVDSVLDAETSEKPLDETAGAGFLEAASRVAPSALEGAAVVSCEAADRPIPGDGFPAVGWVRPGLYTVVSHSGITMGPLLGELVAGEVSEGVRHTLLEGFRPSRFGPGTA